MVVPLALSGATVIRRGKTILGPLSATLAPTGVTVVVGPNGAGKTTLLKSLHGLERLSSGAVAGPDLKEQAYIFQQPIMLRRSVAENLAYPLQLHGTPKAEIVAKSLIWAKTIGLSAAMERPAPRLSGGEKQKLALARALITEPRLLFLDEPCANLDGHATLAIEAILEDAAQAGTRLIMATHDMGQARRLADDAIFLLHGQIHESGPTDTFFGNPQTPELKAFLKGDIVT